MKSLAAECDAHLESEPYKVNAHFDSGSRILTFSVKIDKPVNLMWGVQIGEILHNLRSALDHLIWELVILATGSPPDLPTKLQFPIFKTKERFKSRGIPQQLASVPQAAIDLIESEQPFNVGGDKNPLWHLSELSNCDKHRTLHLTGVMVQVFSVDMPRILEQMEIRHLESAKAGPIQQDAVIGRVHLSGSLPWPFEGNQITGHLKVNMAFSPATPAVGGQLAVPTIEGIAERTEGIVRRVAKEIFHTPEAVPVLLY